MKCKYWTISSLAVVAMSITLTATVRAAAPDAKKIVSMEAKQFALPDTIEMIKIPAGKFTMGSPKDELGRGGDEPQRTITISRPFYMAKFEIKQNQYIPLMRPEYKPIFRGQGPWGHNLPELHQHGAWISDAVPGSQPMDTVQWIHAVEFCKKLTARENAAGRLPKGYEYRLPTEAEWEYACRGGTTGAFNNEKTAKSAKEGKTRKTSNTFGLADMHMGVLEWVLDDYASYPTGDTTDPVSLVNGKHKVVRGGHDQFNDDPRPKNKHYSKPEDRLRYVRSASRGWLMPAWPYPQVGFRPVLAPKIEVPKPNIDPKYHIGVLTPYNSGMRKIDLVGFERAKKRDQATELPYRYGTGDAGASGGLDCSKLKPTKIQKGEWSSPSNTLRSERFDIFWGDKRSSEPWKDFPTDSPKYFDPREVMKTAEAFWTKAVDEMQVYRGDHYVPRDRLRIVIRDTWTTWRGRPGGNGEGWYAIGGGITVEDDGKKSMPGGHIIITPRASRDDYVVTHELTHALQTYAAWDRDPPAPPVDVAAWQVFGMTHESHATFIPLLAGIGDGKTKLCIATLSTKHLRPGRKRPYQNWTWMQFLCDKENPRFFCRVLQDHRSLGMHPFESVKRRKQFSAKRFADYWFEHAQRNVTGDYSTPNIRLTIERMRKDKPPLTVKMLPVAGKRDTFEVPAEFVPQRFAYNHILLRPEGRAEGKSHKIRVTLQGKPNEDKSADWRFGFCVITRDDEPRYVGPASDGKLATANLAADDKQVYLVVMATPDNLSPFDSGDPKEEDVPRYPYTVKIQGAVPD